MGAISQKSAEFLIRSRLADAEKGNVDALFDLGVVYSTGRGGVGVDLIEAHKWFNLAALSGSTRGQECRAEIALEMTAREIADAQRQARAWLEQLRPPAPRRLSQRTKMVTARPAPGRSLPKLVAPSCAAGTPSKTR